MMPPPSTRDAPPARPAPGGASPDTFTTLLDSALPRAYAAARHMTGNAADADDLVQDAAWRAWNGFHRFQPGSNFRAWFMRILTNTYYDIYRRERRNRNTISLDEAPDLFLFGKTAAAGLHDESENPARALLSKLDAQQVHAALHALPEEYRIAAALYFVDELSYQEIAAAIGCPVGTVRSRLHRGRKMLQVTLWQLAQEHGIVPQEGEEFAMAERRAPGGRS